jgi:hypothetical protein
MTDLLRHSLTAQTAATDLRRLLQDDAAADLRGSILRKTIHGRTYVYDRYRSGDTVKDRYIGPDGPELADRLQRMAAVKAEADQRRKQTARLVRILRAEGFLPVDAKTGSLINSMARAGMFRLGATIIGTMAFRLYEGELGVRIGFDQMAQTGDIDFASFERLSVTLATDDRVDGQPGDLFGALNFRPVPSLDGTRIWRWQDKADGSLVEFLTPAFGEEGVRDLPALRVSARALNYLNFLIAEPIKAVVLYRSGVLVQVPRPERFAIHKLIVADRRRDGAESLKANKDRAQADFLIRVLAEDRPDDLRDAWQDARGRGPRWRGRMDATLARMPATAALLAAAGCAA